MIPTDAYGTGIDLLWLLVFPALTVALAMWNARGDRRYYPDGMCFQCRRGAAMPGETCTACGTKQPDWRRP